MWDQKWLLSLQLIRTCTAWYKSCQTGNLTASCCTCNPFLDPEYFTRNPYNSCIVHRNFPFGSWGGDLYTRIRGFSFHLYADFLRHKFPVFFSSQPLDFRNISVLFSNTPEFLREDRKSNKTISGLCTKTLTHKPRSFWSFYGRALLLKTVLAAVCAARQLSWHAIPRRPFRPGCMGPHTRSEKMDIVFSMNLFWV